MKISACFGFWYERRHVVAALVWNAVQKRLRLLLYLLYSTHGTRHPLLSPSHSPSTPQNTFFSNMNSFYFAFYHFISSIPYFYMIYVHARILYLPVLYTLALNRDTHTQLSYYSLSLSWTSRSLSFLNNFAGFTSSLHFASSSSPNWEFGTERWVEGSCRQTDWWCWCLTTPCQRTYHADCWCWMMWWCWWWCSAQSLSTPSCICDTLVLIPWLWWFGSNATQPLVHVEINRVFASQLKSLYIFLFLLPPAPDAASSSSSSSWSSFILFSKCKYLICMMMN